ncbi:hypothetical protein [uncultured Paludibaculum sp.]|uniref:hypothetical protein n=1 Tax=uncultured Paludibaculum sp. TaxID=1765020 RepID=UPI002AAAE47D|nr:hypothetical protein [uncultured Paludibaculum sp.]
MVTKGPTPGEVLDQVRRIASSSTFIGSDPTRVLLLYLAEHSAKHPGESVKEITLASEALGKGTDYDPRTDSSVRVLASRLRSKLAEYYTQEGARDPLLIAIPKGSYSIISTYRASDPHPVHAPESPATPQPARHRLSLLWLAVAVTVAAISAGLGYWFGHSSSIAPAAPGIDRAFWRHFLAGESPLIVFSNPRFVGDPTDGLRLFSPGKGPVGGPVNDQFTGVGEVIAVHDVVRALRGLGREARVKRAQLFSWDDARTSDVILVGGHEENLPVAQLPPLEKFNLKAESQEPFPKLGAVHNGSPLPGEKPYYFTGADVDNGTEYGIVALTQGVNPSRRVLVLAGVHTFGTEGAAAFVCTPALVADLYRKLGLRPSDDIVPFEALIELPVRGGSPLPPRLLLVHRRREAPAAQ